ncbi:MAG TPA: CHAT domain-containing protein [Mycobacteriales bacterium]|nr:CHAT domain-containing protein [Mycobacteriales bacterium]
MADDGGLFTALAEVLARRCLGRSMSGDAELARSLARSLGEVDDARDLFAVGSLGGWAGFGPDDQLDAETIVQVVELCRALLRAELTVDARTLVCASLGLLAERGATSQAPVDFVNVAVSARGIEQHELALWAGRQALARSQELSQSHRVMALLTVAVITRDRAVVEEAYAEVGGLNPDDPAARAATALAPSLRDGEGLTQVGAAVRDRDRQSAAAALVPVFDDLRRGVDDALLSGLFEAFAAMADIDLDVERARRGLIAVVGHLRGRQRFGEVPSVARAGVDMVADLLALDSNPAAANVLTEFIEALADAGMSEITAIPADGLPAVTQARLAELAHAAPVWPDLAGCVAGLRGRSALLIRQQRSLSTGVPTFLALYVAPPEGLAVKSVRLEDRLSATLMSLHRATPEALSRVSVAEVDDLTTEFLPRSLIEDSASGKVTSLVVVPDGPAWSVPWQASSSLSRVDVTLAPSLGVHARVPSDDTSITSVTAVMDDHAPFADVVEDALDDARARGFDIRRPRRIDPSASGDLLITFTHGAGTGLGFVAGTDKRPLTAQLLATTQFRHVLVAACWSSGAPPIAYPVNLPAALLLNGATTVIGGLWPLPAAETARLVANVITEVAGGTGLRHALRTARAAAPEQVISRWGLAVHGGPTAVR